MSSRLFWKFFLSGFFLAWSIYYLVPLTSTPFPDYLRSHATADATELGKKVDEAQKLYEQAKHDKEAADAAKAAAEKAGTPYLPDLAQENFIQRHRTFFLSFKSLAEDDKVDLFQYFPNLRVGDLKNVSRRNDQILNYLLSSSMGRIKYGLDLQGGLGVTLSFDDKGIPATAQLKQESMKDVINIMDRRLNGLGVAEPIIRARGDNSVEIQLPGVNTAENPEAIDAIKKPAILEFRRVHRTIDAAKSPPENDPLDYVRMNQEIQNKDTGEIIDVPVLVSVKKDAGGEILKRAFPQTNQSGQLSVAMEFTPEGAKFMYALTSDLVRDHARFAILLDGKIYSSPAVQGVISDRGEITGDFSQREAIELANVLSNPLERPLKVDAMYEVSPSLAKESEDSSIKAGLLGSLLVIIFMVAMYRVAGVLSIITLALHMVMILGIQSSIHATLTLPGVAALVLTIGMAVDANILIYERMREELDAGKSLAHALTAGFDRALASIIDSNFTTLITSVVLIWLGTGPIKGFGVILAVGLVSNLFCVLVFNQALLELVVVKGWVKTMHFLRLFPATNLPFFSYRKIAIGISLAVILVGLGGLAYHGQKSLGIDFRGGEEVSIQFAQEIPLGSIEQTAKTAGIGEVIATYQTQLGTGARTLKIQTETNQGKKLFDALNKAFPASKLESLGINVIQGTVSDDLKWNALEALALSLLGVMIYVAFRFEVGYAVGAIVATLHDVLVTVGVFVLLGGQFTAPMVAAVLMIIGYSLNDTVIVFDRVREELKLNPQLKLVQVLDLAVNRTLARTTLTSLTTFLAATSLFIFGAGMVSDFALIFMIGILTGTASSIFIANPVFCWWHKGDRLHVESHEFLPKYEWEKH